MVGILVWAELTDMVLLVGAPGQGESWSLFFLLAVNSQGLEWYLMSG